MVRLPGRLAYRVVAIRDRRFIRVPEIGVANGAVLVDLRERCPEGLRCFSISAANVNPNNLAGFSVDCEPNPLFIIFISNKRPQFVTFDY